MTWDHSDSPRRVELIAGGEEGWQTEDHDHELNWDDEPAGVGVTVCDPHDVLVPVGTDNPPERCYFCTNAADLGMTRPARKPLRRVATAHDVGSCASCLGLIHAERLLELCNRFVSHHRWDFAQSDLLILIQDLASEFRFAYPPPRSPRLEGRLPLVDLKTDLE